LTITVNTSLTRKLMPDGGFYLLSYLVILHLASSFTLRTKFLCDHPFTSHIFVCIVPCPMSSESTVAIRTQPTIILLVIMKLLCITSDYESGVRTKVRKSMFSHPKARHQSVCNINEANCREFFPQWSAVSHS
jgi:hypothetical protein